MAGQQDTKLIIAATAAATAASIGIGALVWYRYGSVPGLDSSKGSSRGADPSAAARQRRGPPALDGQSPARTASDSADSYGEAPPGQQQRQPKSAAVPQRPPPPSGPPGSQVRLSGAAAAMLSMVTEEDEEGEDDDAEQQARQRERQRQVERNRLSSASDPAPALPTQQRIVSLPPPRPLPRAVQALAQQDASPSVHSNSAPAVSEAPPAAPAAAGQQQGLPAGSANPTALAQASKSLSAIYSSVGKGAPRQKMAASARAERLAASNQADGQLSSFNAPAVISRPEPSVRVGSLTSDSSLDSRPSGLAATSTPRWQPGEALAPPSTLASAAAPHGGDYAGATAWPAGGLPMARPQQQLGQRRAGVTIPDSSSTATSSVTSIDVRSSSSSAPGNSFSGVRRSSTNDAQTVRTTPCVCLTTMPLHDATVSNSRSLSVARC